MHLSQLTGITSPSTRFTSFATLPEDVAFRFIVWAIALSGLIFFVRLVISGYLYLTSVGDPGKVQAATKNLINSALGLFVVTMSFFIAQIIFAVLGINTVV